MTFLPRSFLVLIASSSLFLGVSFALPASAACCVCASKQAPASKLCLTTAGGCATVIADAKNDKLADVTCDSTKTLEENRGECRTVAEGGLCQTISLAATYQPPAAKSDEAATPVTSLPLTLNVPIPGLQFAQGLREIDCPRGAGGRCLAIPFLAQYVTAGFNYLLGIVVIAAAVMIVYGGFKYILSASLSGVQSGKEIVKDALIGLALVLSLVTILQTINPATTLLQAVSVRVVSKEPFTSFANAQLTTQVATVSGAPGSSDTGVELAPCPFELSQPLILKENMQEKENQKILREWGMTDLNIRQDRRAQEFFQKIQAYTSGKPIPERIALTSNAAAACGVHLMSCGATAGTIWELSGIGDQACLTTEGMQGFKVIKDAAKGCNPHESYYGRIYPKETKKPILETKLNIPTGEQQAKFNNLLCAAEGCPTPPDPKTCIKERGAAIEFVRKELEKTEGWPDKQLNELKPGDIIQVYTGNRSCGGGHSALFFGWTSGGAAKVIHGEIGKKVSAGTLCIKKSCGANMLPLLRVIKPILSPS